MNSNTDTEMTALSCAIKGLINDKQYEECYEFLRNIMTQYPHNPDPHNWIGILFEKQGKHNMAIKHFRAARALDPVYRPAQINLERCEDLYGNQNYIYNEEECLHKNKSRLSFVKLNQEGIGYLCQAD